MLLALAHAREVYDYAKINCYIKHLKSLNQIELEYPEHHVSRNTLLHDCELNIKNLKADMYKAVRTKMKKNQQIAEFADCIVDYLKSEFWAEIQMRFIVYDASQLPVAERRRKQSEMEELSESKSEIGINYCLHEHQFGALFDELSKSDNKTEKERLVNECGRKYLIDNRIGNEYEINVTESLNYNNECDVILEEFEYEVEDSLVRDIKEINPSITNSQMGCICGKYAEESYSTRMLEFSIISQLNLNPSQYRNEKKSFVKFLSLITHKVRECVWWVSIKICIILTLKNIFSDIRMLTDKIIVHKSSLIL